MKNKIKIKVGDKVDYHSLVGGEVTSTGHEVTELYPKPNNFGCDCAMITGKSGVVNVAALSLTPFKMQTMTLDEYRAALQAQGEPNTAKWCLVCPMCGTVQNADDLIAAGAGMTFDDIEKFLGFSCVGRFTHGKPPPKRNGTQDGCNWTLGGLFRCHTLEVVTPDGKHHPRFAPATREQAQAHLKR
jgi:hypothetical protein